MRFFLTDLGPQQLILGYPWFAAMQPKIDWARGWIDYTQLPVVIRTPGAQRTTFAARRNLAPPPKRNPHLYVRRIAHQTKASQLAERTLSQKIKKVAIPNRYRKH